MTLHPHLPYPWLPANVVHVPLAGHCKERDQSQLGSPTCVADLRESETLAERFQPFNHHVQLGFKCHSR